MNVLLQYPNMEEPPVGVWWDEGGVAKSYYAEPFRAESKMGVMLMRSRNMEVPLETVFEKLAERMPTTVNWELADIGEALTPEEYLDMIRRVGFHVLGVA